MSEFLRTQLGRGLAEVALAEVGKVLNRRETALVGDLVKRLGGGLYLPDHHLALAVEQPLGGGFLESLLELALERRDTHVGRLGKLLDTCKRLVMVEHEPTEHAVAAKDRGKHPRQLILCVVDPHQQEHLLQLQLVEVGAMDAVSKALDDKIDELAQLGTYREGEKHLPQLLVIVDAAGEVVDGAEIAKLRHVGKRAAQHPRPAML